MGRALRGAAHVGHVRRHGLACSPPPGRAQESEAPGRGARGAARAAEAVPSRRLARAAYARDDCPRASRRPPAERARASPRSRRRSRRARSDRADPSAAPAAREDRSSRLRSSRRHRRRVVSRGRLHALVGGRAARVASRPAPGGIPARRPGGASDRSRLVARERRPLHRTARMRSSSGRGQRERRSCSRSKTKAAVSIRTRSGTSSSASPERIPRGPARTAGSGWGSPSSTRSRRRTAEAAP